MKPQDKREPSPEAKAKTGPRHYKIFFVDMKDEDGIQQVYAAAETLQAGIGLTKLEATGKLMFELRWTDGKEASV